jgi:hypothetical protein
MAQNDQKPYDAGDEKDVAQAKRKEHNETKQEINDLHAIMDTKAGRRTMWRLLSKCGVYHESFSPDALLMANREGSRKIGLQYLELLTTHCLDKYQLMEKEQRERV